MTRLFGSYPFRCECCAHLFQANIYSVGNLLYAKCPTCHRMDLGRWSRDYYSPPFATRFMLNVGARPIRCEYCRNNFWSFRMVREKFSREKRAARSQVINPAAGPFEGEAVATVSDGSDSREIAMLSQQSQ
ncbi:MAG TPA: hypothetical protein VFQ91_07790 [Bryobacteraceae bacterium]|nr:hypothetical protein [Bryobacteraceae bacterium]